MGLFFASPKYELVSCKEDYYNVDHRERSSQDATITTALLVVVTLAMTSWRTATVPTATRRTHIASTTAKE